ncbi:MAG: FAD-dependent oxidoreductase [Lachnospiraceae bacterium]|nr:FAD-dependent oxidoreductase [Lachnospiraceae bacterium]
MKKSENNSNMSRRDFLRGATAGAASLAASGLFGGMGSLVHAEEAAADAIYIAGTYSATAMGIGAVTVTMTFDETSITEVVVDVSNETADIGQLYGETLQEALMAAQSAEIDGVSGATVTSDAVKEAAANCIAQAMGVAEALDATSEEAESGSWKDAPDPVDDSEIVETYDADVVVVGHGYAGLNACRYLASQGISVILIESQSEDSYQAMGNEAGTPNASVLLDLGVPEIDPIEYYNNWMVNSGYQANPGLVMKFCQNSGAAMDEYLSVLSEEDLSYMTTAFYPPTEHQMSSIGAYKFWPSTCSFYSSECNQTYIHQKNREKAIEDGATFLFSTEAQQLVMEDDAVVGLIATNADGDYIKFNCQAVILATGGFGANSQMQEDLLTDLGGCLTPDESFSVLMDSDGRGIQMGYWVGAKLDSLGIPTMNGKHYHPGYPQGVWLDADGKRYCNEYWGPIEFRGRPALQMQRSFYAFYDSKLPEYLEYSVPSHGSTYADEDTIAGVEEELANALAAGSEGVQGNDLSATYTRYGAETLDELLDLVCTDDTVKENIKASIERYNELCEAGTDEDFGRESELMFPVKEGPFYCDIKVPDIGWMMCTCGGLLINAEQQVLDDYYKPIKGLFASGNCASGRFGTEYFTPTPGVSLGTTITLGRECGKSVEKFLNGEL